MTAITHHWSSVRDAIAIERERAGKLVRIDEVDYLPAALEIVARPVSPTARTVMWLMLAGLACAMLWLTCGRIDIVASAPGRLVPTGEVKLVQPAQPGIVRRILTRDGAHVRAGQPLVTLDPTAADADAGQARAQLATATLDAARARALLAALDGRGFAFVAPPGTPPAVAATQAALARAGLDSLMASVSGHVADGRAALAASAGAREQAAKLSETIPLLDQQVAANEAMAAKGYVSRLRVLDLRRQQLGAIRDREAAIQNARREGATAMSAASGLAQARADARARVLTDLAKAEQEIGLRRDELAKAEQRSSLQILRAPSDGIVTALALHTVGGVVEATKPVMEIVPEGAPLIAEGRVMSRDMGFLKIGQAVALKIDAYPFTRYGTVPARIVSISPDAVDDEKLGLVYVVRARPDRAHPDRDASLALMAGMAVTLDIRTGRRRMIDYLTSPAREAASDAGRER